MTLRARLTLSAALAVAAAVVIASAAVYFVVRSELRDEVDASLRERAAAIEGPGRGPSDEDFPHVPPPLLGGPGGYVQIVSSGGAAARQPGSTVELPIDDRTKRVAAGEEGAYVRDADITGTHVRILTVPFREGLALQIARPLTEVDDVLGRLRLILLGVALGGIGLAALLGLGVAE